MNIDYVVVATIVYSLDRGNAPDNVADILGVSISYNQRVVTLEQPQTMWLAFVDKGRMEA